MFSKINVRAILYHIANRILLFNREGSVLMTKGMNRQSVPAIFVPESPVTDNDVQICMRLLKAYKAAKSQDPAKEAQDIWSATGKVQMSFFDVLGADDPKALATYLAGAYRRDATHGMCQGDREYQRLKWDGSYRRFNARVAKDKLVLLAEAVGAIGPENPEQGGWGSNSQRSIDSLVSLVEKAVGISITPPAIDGGLLKIKSSHAAFGERDLHSVYTAWLIKQIGSGNIIEIGAGTGRVAYWSMQMGASHYTTLDLVQSNVLQGYYLLKSCPEIPIRLFDEPVPTSDRSISVLPHFAIQDPGNRGFDLVLNQDSFPEIDRGSVLDYLKWIKLASKRHFLSINQEARAVGAHEQGPQNSVPELVLESGGFRRLSRSPYWLRRGYVMELYEVNSQS